MSRSVRTKFDQSGRLVLDNVGGVALPGATSSSSSGPSGPLTAKTGATLAALGTGDYDGQFGVLRIGTWPNVHEEILKWNSSLNKWIGDPITVMTQSDTWSLDLLDKPDMTQWGYLVSPNFFSGNIFSWLTSAVDFGAAAFSGGTGVVPINNAGNFATSGSAKCRGNRFNYTGKTASSLTGCTRTFAGMTGNVPINAYVTQGDPGGFGTVCSPLPFAQELFAAGLSLQEKLIAFMNGSLDTKALSIAAYWMQYNSGDGYVTPVDSPSGGLGFSAILVGSTNAGGALGSERSFVMAENSWTTWPLSIPNKRFMVPHLYGRMAAGATDSGQVVDATLRVRWATP